MKIAREMRRAIDNVFFNLKPPWLPYLSDSGFMAFLEKKLRDSRG